MTDSWRVVYDPRGELNEPHTKHGVRLGTIEVDEYLGEITSHTVEDLEVTELIDNKYPTKGPMHRYGAILFIEKQGFNPLFREVKLAERYDIAIMSTKGQSVVAARKLVDELCYVGGGCPILVLHDFDKEGFLISERLTSVSEEAQWSGRARYEFANEIEVVDLGLRLADIKKYKLQSEHVRFKGSFAHDSITTAAEQAFLRNNQRVELNAFTSAEFIEWVESKLKAHGVKKIVPDSDTLTDAFNRAVQIAHINANLPELCEAAVKISEETEPPADLAKRVKTALAKDPAKSWDKVVSEIAKEALDDDWAS